ncbi:hypothetical protein HYDPIDRAFT_34652 [Hydnomerulius pinastri MD-312]|uniref:BTB domain-containing protein n=1 Tax=Hydnomerulius pinastri MD-312 TaxID=994086 RepID=A0A0C9W6S2_9AGAM|nr:hypothetical protein HYDPIDRAFT_34652 [Hydnomerulius pinastri MD-312]
MLEPEQAPVELLLRKSLLGEELINTQFHLFSSRSKSSGKVSKPRTLCANNVLLTESAKYFLDLLSSTETVWDASVLAIAGQDIVPDGIPVCECGYESDSDLDDEDYINVMLSFQAGDIEAPEDARCTIKPAPEDELESDEEGSEGLFMVERERPELSGVCPAPWSEAQVPAVPVNPITARLKSIGSRHLFVKDTAFQTWYTFLSYLYTGQIAFLPLKSSGKRSEGSSVGPGERPRCSAKSMYRLARKIGLDDLRDKALDFIRSHLTEDNILQEIACNFTSRFASPSSLFIEIQR